jgi:hypothetical protein
LIARNGISIEHFWRDETTNTWLGPQIIVPLVGCVSSGN